MRTPSTLRLAIIVGKRVGSAVANPRLLIETVIDSDDEVSNSLPDIGVAEYKEAQ